MWRTFRKYLDVYRSKALNWTKNKHNENENKMKQKKLLFIFFSNFNFMLEQSSLPEDWKAKPEKMTNTKEPRDRRILRDWSDPTRILL